MSIEFRNVYKEFGGHQVLRGISFTARTGEITFLLGRSGTGKSVSLKLIVGLLNLDRGSILVDHTPVEHFNEAQWRNLRSHCGMVFQHPALLDFLSVFENITFGLQHLSDGEKSRRAVECLNLVHLEASILDRKPQTLSYGMQKRVSLARTLASRPQILLFDEPTTGLDPITTRSINGLIWELSKKLNITSLVVSHDMECALDIADQVLVLDQGAIVCSETPQRLNHHPHPTVQGFLEEHRW